MTSPHKCIHIFIFSLVALLVSCATESHYRLEPTGYAIRHPDSDETTYNEYIEESRRRIRAALSPLLQEENPFMGNYSINELVHMRAPFSLYPSEEVDCSSENVQKGFLLLHGLGDMSYNMRSLSESLQEQFPCAIYFVPLMDGHGTVPGDGRVIQNDDWLATFRYSLNQLKKEAEEIYLVGYSAGGTYIVHHLMHNADDSVKAAVLLAPGLELVSKLASIANVAKHFTPFVEVHPEVNAVKYISLSMNFTSEYYMLLQELNFDVYIDTPVFVAASSEDETVSSERIKRFYCTNIVSEKKRMLWYAGLNISSFNCENVSVIESSQALEEWNVYNHSHLAFVAPPSDPHYGLGGAFINCEHYSNGQYSDCISDTEEVVYGARNLLGREDILRGRLLRRSVFNPFYDDLIAEITEFLKNL